VESFIGTHWPGARAPLDIVGGISNEELSIKIGGSFSTRNFKNPSLNKIVMETGELP
jgi:hypothetical protein